MKSDMEFYFSSTRLGSHVPQPKAQEESGVTDLLAARQFERKRKPLFASLWRSYETLVEIRREASADALPLQGIVHFEVRRFPETTALQRKLFIPLRALRRLRRTGWRISPRPFRQLSMSSFLSLQFYDRSCCHNLHSWLKRRMRYAFDSR